jgi:REP element-mobilizing transposase RayT
MTYYERNLPHWHPEGKAIFLTWRLYGSLPKGKHRGTATPGCAPAKRTGESAGARRTGKSAGATEPHWARRFRKMDAELDLGSRGPLWLRDPEIASYVEESIVRGAELGHYNLHAYVVMPNHVHILIEPCLALARITRGLKGVSARDANATLGRVGKPFWQDESFDHWVRSASEFERIRSYIEHNPVSAGLVAQPRDWPWSSASLRGSAQPRVAVPRAGQNA